MRVVAFDPGPHTGIAEYVVERDGEASFHSAQVAGDFPTVADTVHSFVEGGADYIVVEDFRIGGQRGSEANFTIEVIGAIKAMALFLDSEDPPIPVLMQAPGSHRFATDDKFRALGWRPIGRHAKSAAGHLLVHLVNSGAVRPEQLVIQ